MMASRPMVHQGVHNNNNENDNTAAFDLNSFSSLQILRYIVLMKMLKRI